MKLLDERATDVAGTSLFLSRAEYRELYPHRMGSRINYLFKYDKPMEVPDKEAELLLEKYSHVIIFKEKIELGTTERHKELAKMKYIDIKRTALKLGFTFAEAAIVKNLLINNIVDTETRISEATKKEKDKKESK